MRIEAYYEGRPWGTVDLLEYTLTVTKGKEHFEALSHLTVDNVMMHLPAWEALLAIKGEILATKLPREMRGYNNFARQCKAIYDERRKLDASDDAVHSEAGERASQLFDSQEFDQLTDHWYDYYYHRRMLEHEDYYSWT